MSPGETLRTSVIVCTHNRRDSLRDLLHGLAAQDSPPGGMDVVVAADSCTDGTPGEVLEAMERFPHPLELVETWARNAAAARNAGARKAAGEVLLFLDDDMLPSPGLVREHAAAQRDAGVVIGYARPVPGADARLWQLHARIWWEDRFRDMARPHHRFSYQDLFSGNFSIKRELFLEAGGFDETLGRLEDYELGIRLVKRNALFTFRPGALTLHRESGSQQKWLQRQELEGGTFVRLEAMHPELRGRFHRVSPDGTLSGWLRHTGLRGGWGARALLDILGSLLSVFERMRLRGLWQMALGSAGEVLYWRGAGAALREEGRSPVVSDAAQTEGPSLREKPILEAEALPPGETFIREAAEKGYRITLSGVPVASADPEPGLTLCEPRHFLFPLSLAGYHPRGTLPFFANPADALPGLSLPVEIVVADLEKGEEGLPSLVWGPDMMLLARWERYPLGYVPLPGPMRCERRGLLERLLRVFQEPLRGIAALKLLEKEAGRGESGGVLLPDLVLIRRRQPGPGAEECAGELEHLGVERGKIRILERDGPRLELPAGAGGGAIILMEDGMMPEAGWLEALLEGLRNPDVDIVVSQAFPASILTGDQARLMRSRPWRRGPFPFLFEERERLLEAVPWLLHPSAPLLAAIRTGLPAPDRGSDAGHLSLLCSSLESGKLVRYEPRGTLPWRLPESDPGGRERLAEEYAALGRCLRPRSTSSPGEKTPALAGFAWRTAKEGVSRALALRSLRMLGMTLAELRALSGRGAGGNARRQG
ncbi:MAG: glycosyltransferase family A protein [Bacteroidota bacterium]